MVVLVVILFVAIAVTVTWIQGMRRYRAISHSPIVKNPAYQFKMENLAIPAGIYFSPTHSWAHLQTNGMAKIGVDAFIQGLTGVLSDVKVPEPGTDVKQGDPLFSIMHKEKQLVIYAPVSGKIKGINSEALQNMRMLHRDPYSYGWLVELEPSNWETETQRLYLGQRTSAWLKTEVSRIRDFFAHSFAPSDAENGLVLLQDGGDIAECALAFAGKGLWGSFQKLILNQANAELTPNS
ncbi:MAG: hypothetical protein HN525_05425 [Candidatus Marinimicrobia bacterium]|jgi:glycine cleavage system H protein|nr:hypothetical protein [Candidatus Neomarinimicrobiota bacterium]MBT5465082.1 hypothetical protein [Candidatus Neomarinimicrobiota bacterium]